jgi:hypothetical protein
VLYTNSENKKTVISPGFGTTSTIGLHQNKATKRVGCFTIKTLIEESKLLVFDADVIHEMSTFVQKGNTYKADDTYHDDLMMCLVMFGWLTTNQYFTDLTNIDIRKQMFENRDKEIEAELLPHIIIDDGVLDSFDVTVDDKGTLWFPADVDPEPFYELEYYRELSSFSKSKKS